MIQYRKIIKLHHNRVSIRRISLLTDHSREKVTEVINLWIGLDYSALTDGMASAWLEEILFPNKRADHKGCYLPDWEKVHKEMLKKNLPLKLFHKEYEQEARLEHKIPYAYRTFCEKYGIYGQEHKLTLPIHRKPGEILEVDWAGSTLFVQDSDTGERLTIYIFVAPLLFSQKIAMLKAFMI